MTPENLIHIHDRDNYALGAPPLGPSWHQCIQDHTVLSFNAASTFSVTIHSINVAPWLHPWYVNIVVYMRADIFQQTNEWIGETSTAPLRRPFDWFLNCFSRIGVDSSVTLKGQMSRTCMRRTSCAISRNQYHLELIYAMHSWATYASTSLEFGRSIILAKVWGTSLHSFCSPSYWGFFWMATYKYWYIDWFALHGWLFGGAAYSRQLGFYESYRPIVWPAKLSPLAATNGCGNRVVEEASLARTRTSPWL